MSKQIQVGAVAVGGGAAVSIQSMCNTPTQDVESTVGQILRLEAAGCEIIRVAVPDADAARAVGEIKRRIHIPLVCDIHFDYKLALLCAQQGADKMQRWMPVRTKFASTPATSALRIECGPWRMPAGSGGFPFASASTAARWKKSCWPNTAALRRRLWWRVPWVMCAC